MKCFKKKATHNKFIGFYVEIASKLDKYILNVSSFNPFPSLPSVATNDRKQIKQTWTIIFGISVLWKYSLGVYV